MAFSHGSQCWGHRGFSIWRPCTLTLLRQFRTEGDEESEHAAAQHEEPAGQQLDDGDQEEGTQEEHDREGDEQEEGDGCEPNGKRGHEGADEPDGDMKQQARFTRIPHPQTVSARLGYGQHMHPEHVAPP